MGKQKKLKQMRREMREAGIRQPITVLDNTTERHYVTLDEAKEMFADNDPADLEKMYSACIKSGRPGLPVTMPVQLGRNNKRALKKAYLKDGWNGVEKVYDDVQETINRNTGTRNEAYDAIDGKEPGIIENEVLGAKYEADYPTDIIDRTGLEPAPTKRTGIVSRIARIFGK
jgi:hypothetical protein